MTATTLFPAALRSSLSAEARARIDARLVPFARAGVLGPLEVQVVGRLAELAGATDPEVLLGLAFAVRAPQHGHVCVDLRTLSPDDVLPEDPDARSTPDARAVVASWPTDGAAWAEAVARAGPLVRPAPPGVGPPDPPTTPFVVEAGRVYLDRWWRYQRRLAGALLRRAAAPVPRDKAPLAAGLDQLFRPPGAHPEPPSLNRQRLAGALALLRPLTVISGGPGMGKTWTVRNVLALLWLERRAQVDRPALRVALAAPTGKAAARMRESLRSGLDAEFLARLDAVGGAGCGEAFRALVLAVEPRTLHRLLGYRPDRPTRFRRDARNPLVADVVVVDEASMVDLAMMTKLVDAVRPAARLVLLGDRNQLASVDAGTVLADLCGPTSGNTLALPSDVGAACCHDLAVHGLDSASVQAGRPLQGSVIQLNKTFRFRDDSGIGAFARACLADEINAQDAAQLLDDPIWPDVRRLPWPEGTGLGAALSALVRDGYRPALELLLGGFEPARDGCVEVFHRRVLDALDQFRVLCAHRRGRAGVSGVNRDIAALLVRAHPALTSQGPRAWLGRPVLVTENAYAVGRFNGDVGFGVTRDGHPTDGPLVVAFPGPDALPPAAIPPEAVAQQVAQGELRLVEYLDPARLPAWQPVYAMTIHKSQGSEFDHAVVVLPERRSPILTRELIYTGVTRAKGQVTLVGDRMVLEAALERPVRRASGLLDLLWADPPEVQP